jgi:hypothetical protein
MTREDIVKMALEAKMPYYYRTGKIDNIEAVERFARLVAEKEREACIDIIETYRIPVGNSASGELACEWTYAALHEIRDDIRARGETK